MGIDKQLSDAYPSVIINRVKYHYGRDPEYGEYLVENAYNAKDCRCFQREDDLVAYLVNLPESAVRDRLRLLYPDWSEVTSEQREAYMEEDLARLRAKAEEKMKAGTAQQFDMDLDGRNGPHDPQRVAGTGLSPHDTNFVLGVWYGAQLPSLGEEIQFDLEAETPEERTMIPFLSGEPKIPEPGARPRYVMAEVIDPHYGLAIVHGSTIDREYAVHRTEQYERGAITPRSFEAEQERQREPARKAKLELELEP